MSRNRPIAPSRSVGRSSSPLWTVAALALVAAVPGFAHAADAVSPDGFQDVRGAHWASLPSGADIARLYPSEAAKTHTSGYALVHCRVQNSGELSACEPTVESPAGYGFADATVAMARHFKLAPGRYAPDATLDIPFQWRLQ